MSDKAATGEHLHIGDTERLLRVIRGLLHETYPERRPEVTLHASFERDLALDSLARVELFLRAGKEFGVDLPSDALAEVDTAQDLLRFLGRESRVTNEPAPSIAGMQAVAAPEAAHTLIDVLEWHASRHAERIHILLQEEQHQDQAISYGNLYQSARSVALSLQAHGLQPRDAVALMLPTGRDYLAGFFGVMLAGGIPVPIYPPARMAQMEDHLKRHALILRNAEVRLMLTVPQAKPLAIVLQASVPSLSSILTRADLSARHADAGSHMLPCPQAGDIAFLQYTSGSTGNPKGVMLTHANLLANIRALGAAVNVTKDDVFVSWLPLYHDMGLIGAWFGSLYYGMPLVLMSPLAFLARPALWLQNITRHRGTLSAAPNFAYELCIRHVSDTALSGIDLSSWRMALNGAEPVSPATLDAFAARFAACGFRRTALTPVYGLAECSVGLAFPPRQRGPRIDVIDSAKFSFEGKAIPTAPDASDTLAVPSCGRTLTRHEIRIVDDAGVELPERRVGRLEFRGPSATSGYYRNPEATRKLFRNGWLDSGDNAYMVNGEIYVTGRVKDLIKRGGRSLYPYELEQAVGELPGIRRGCVAVFASPDQTTGTEKLVVMAETRERDESARKRLRDAVTRTAVDIIGTPPDDVALVPPHSILKTSSGKIRRLASREMYERGMNTDTATSPWPGKARILAKSASAYARVRARRIGGWLYGAYVWVAFLALVIPAGALAIILQRPPVGRRIARHAARLFFRLAGVRVSAKGLENLPRQAHVLLVNHASYLDAIALTAALPPTPGYVFAVKGEFRHQPLMRVFLASLGEIFIERHDARHSTQDVDLMATALRRGSNLLVFPEGTFTREAGIKPFHLGAFLAAGKEHAPLAIAVLRGTREALRAGTLQPHRCAIEFEVGEVFAHRDKEWSSSVALSSEARAAMVRLSGEFALPA